MPEKLEQAAQGVFAKLNFAIEDEARTHGVGAHELRLALIERLFNATDVQLREWLHVEADKQAAAD